MSFWSFLGSNAGAAAGEVVKSTAGSIGTLAKDIRTALTGVSPEVKGELEKIAAQIEQHASTLQGDLLKLDAQSGNFFQAGWRPSVGWICSAALAWHYIARDFTFYFVSLIWPQAPLPPRLDVTDLIALLFAMLGYGGLRTVEKLRAR